MKKKSEKKGSGFLRLLVGFFLNIARKGIGKVSSVITYSSLGEGLRLRITKYITLEKRKKEPNLGVGETPIVSNCISPWHQKEKRATWVKK